MEDRGKRGEGFLEKLYGRSISGHSKTIRNDGSHVVGQNCTQHVTSKYILSRFVRHGLCFSFCWHLFQAGCFSCLSVAEPHVCSHLAELRQLGNTFVHSCTDTQREQ